MFSVFSLKKKAGEGVGKSGAWRYVADAVNKNDVVRIPISREHRVEGSMGRVTQPAMMSSEIKKQKFFTG